LTMICSISRARLVGAAEREPDAGATRGPDRACR
jgi:hypothetical protein